MSRLSLLKNPFTGPRGFTINPEEDLLPRESSFSADSFLFPPWDFSSSVNLISTADLFLLNLSTDNDLLPRYSSWLVDLSPREDLGSSVSGARSVSIFNATSFATLSLLVFAGFLAAFSSLEAEK